MKKQILAVLFLLAVFVGISYGQNEKKPIYSILLDNTGSMRTQLTTVKNVGIEVVEQTNERGEISIFNFDSAKSKNGVAEVNVGADWSGDKKLIEKYIDGLYAVGGQTVLADGIRLSGEELVRKAASEKDKISEKILILVTDGEDRGSYYKPKELVKFLKENSIKVYAVALVEQLSKEAGFSVVSPRAKASEFLKKLAKETGGNVIFPKEKQTIADAVKSLFAENIKDSK